MATGGHLSYRDAGVDIDAGDELVQRIAPAARSTHRPGVLDGLGGFGGLFELPAGYRSPVLVAGTDGVGTKLMLARRAGRHHGLGIDLVAMCVNDIVVCGAEPLFFLDYYATGRLDVDAAAAVVEGIAEGCRLAGCALLGGETAEMPGLYAEGDFDLAGFAVGCAERDRLLDGSAVQAGDRIVGLASSGPHANGYSLIRRILDHTGADLDEQLADSTLADALLAPTRIYAPAVLDLLGVLPVHAIAHVTGGGLITNLPRVLPDGVDAAIDRSAWQRPAVFDWLQDQGGVSDSEMLRTFNCGLGMCLILPEDIVDSAVERLTERGETAAVVGRVIEAEGPARVRVE